MFYIYNWFKLVSYFSIIFNPFSTVVVILPHAKTFSHKDPLHSFMFKIKLQYSVHIV